MPDSIYIIDAYMQTFPDNSTVLVDNSEQHCPRTFNDDGSQMVSINRHNYNILRPTWMSINDQIMFLVYEKTITDALWSKSKTWSMFTNVFNNK